MESNIEKHDLSSRLHEIHSSGLSRKDISKDIGASLPSKMYFLPEIYELERRAIFSKYWFLVSHKARYQKIGDFVQYDMAGFNFVVVRNKEDQIKGFHNICRHRAFPVVSKPCGNAKIFACKYHGWSYDLNGLLTKAPRFTPDSVQGFDPRENGLFPVHTHVDRNGFVYVNLDAKETPEVEWESQYGPLDQQEVLISSGVDWSAVEFDLTWTKEGQFNWKLMQDNYNECYHCLTAHRDVATTTNLDSYYVVPGADGTFISHFSEPKTCTISFFDETRFAGRSATHVFPVGHFSPNPGTGFMHLMRSVPTGPTSTRQEYDVYRLNTPHANPEAHQRMLEFYQKVIQEDLDLCNAAQKNLSRGVYVSGPLHPFHEEGVIAFQEMVLDKLSRHLQGEKKANSEIWPAERQDGRSNKRKVACIEVLACAARSKLDW